MLTAADQNTEFNNILNNPISLISPTTGAINFNLQAHTNILPSALTASSGSAGSVLVASTAATPAPLWSTGANAGSVFMATTAAVPRWSTGPASGSVFIANTDTLPVWSAGASTGSVFVATTGAAPVWSSAAGTGNVFITDTGGVPVWLGLGVSGQVLTVATSGRAAWQGGASPYMSVTGAVGSVTSSQKVTLSADRYLLITTSANPSGFLMTSTASYTIDVSSSVVGPIANGRDQASTFSSTGSWVSLWCISTGAGSTAPAGLASLAAPPAFPTLPTSYSGLAYVNTIYYTSAASPTFLNGTVRENIYSYSDRQTALSVGASTSLANIDLSQFVPPRALSDLIYASPRSISNNVFSVTLSLTSSAGAGSHAVISLQTNGVGAVDQPGPLLIVPNVAQQLTYSVSTSAGQISLFVHGYTVAA